MARKWKPGDVVTATVNGRENVRLVAGWSKYDPQLRWCELSPRWDDGDDEKCWFFPSQVTDARPLVVIDPEDREQVDRLHAALSETCQIARRNAHTGHDVIGHMQAALREFADPTPPRPDEPTGLGAVVVDESEVEWVHLGSGLWCYGTTDGPSHGYGWTHVHAVRVLSEGVTA